ncbi:MAG: peptidoglycan-binding protein, partial [Gammaproteobacteria bacterium]
VAKEQITLPSERAGLVMVFRTFEKMSYGLVMSADRPLAVNDLVQNP